MLKFHYKCVNPDNILFKKIASLGSVCEYSKYIIAYLPRTQTIMFVCKQRQSQLNHSCQLSIVVSHG